MKILISLFFALLVSGAGFLFRALDFSGFAAATFVGAAIFLGAGLPGAAVLIFFFVLGSALSRLPSEVVAPEQKARSLDSARDVSRDWRQVLANGLWPALLALGYGVRQDEAYYLAFVSSLAAAGADTASGEVGVRWAKRTFSILNFRSVPPGVSGGISLTGTLAGLAGAVLVALVGVGPKGWDFHLSFKSTLLVAAMGFMGMLFDSLLGALVQAKYRCTVCRSAVEVPRHCGKPAERTSGLAVLDNDGVNFLATMFGAALGLVLF
ncbi:MAG: DUF92 domain-containing protein [candidate division Zixibacteria bacterium]|nr:DUF92 domain-containing protein [candidate division Zixibacteria bacterium]MCI0596073.1 DUF92 domain-containing protein [candidate division Zixibacteria bacterium]